MWVFVCVCGAWVCGMAWYGTAVAIVVAANFILGVGTKDKKKRKGAHLGGRLVGSLAGGV